MSQVQMRQVFKEFRVVSASDAVQLGLSVTAMLLCGQGWQLYGQGGCVAKGNGIEYFQAIMRNELVPVIPPPAVEEPKEEVKAAEETVQ